jgi:hypothetical protein
MSALERIVFDTVEIYSLSLALPSGWCSAMTAFCMNSPSM